MNILTLFLTLLLGQLNSQIVTERKTIDVEGIEKNITKEYNDFFKRHYKKRNLASGNPIFIDPVVTSIIYNESLIQTISVKIKAQGDISQIIFYDKFETRSVELLSCELEMEDNKGNKIPLGENETCILRDIYYIEINVNLKNDYLLNLKTQVINRESSFGFFSTYKSTYILPLFPGIKCKFIFILDKTLVLTEFIYGESLVKILNNTAFIYDDICPEKAKIVRIQFTPYQVIWESTIEITMKIKEKPENAMIIIPSMFTQGNTFNFIKNEIKTNVEEYEQDDRDIYIDLYDFPEDEVYFKWDLIFSSCPIKWNIPPFVKEKNTSTNETLLLAKEILKNDTSSKPDFKKIGEWVKSYITYDLSYLGKRKSISEILSNKKGVCEHYTILYNALLNSIGIQALSLMGYIIKDLDKPFESPHAWTLAKIDNQWMALDATWGIFTGAIPQNHLFEQFNGIGITTYNKGGNVTFEIKRDIKFLEVVKKPNITEDEKDFVAINTDNLDNNLDNTDLTDEKKNEEVENNKNNDENEKNYFKTDINDEPLKTYFISIPNFYILSIFLFLLY